MTNVGDDGSLYIVAKSVYYVRFQSKYSIHVLYFHTLKASPIQFAQREYRLLVRARVTLQLFGA